MIAGIVQETAILLTKRQKARASELLSAGNSLFKHEGRVYSVDKNVFPPQLGYTTARLLRIVANCAATSKYALDMGCGMGIVAFVMKTHGACHVWGVDSHVPAIQNALSNAAAYPILADIKFRRSNLFQNIPPRIKFDLVVFNQPAYPLSSEKKIMGMGKDGGRSIIQRFLREAPCHCASDAKLLMTFSEIAGQENNPARLATKLGFDAFIIDKYSKNGMKHFIYEIRNAK